MYTRSYDNEGRIKIPENYDGNAFFESPPPEMPPPAEKEKEPLIAPWDAPKNPPPEEESVPTLAKGAGGIFGKYLKKLPFGSLNIFGEGGFKLGTEEILIIGVALFLFFSGSGDKECAIMLLLLLLVN